ncbi:MULTISPECIES: hypothetical protein [Planktothricoides]|uniref:Uncharacterized protein n=1 Tax=Planktothricoides raciborskii FACHB-1370 TaxID=2949576 RepID=A0ABR8EBT8_9CYAN|nr:MULTISPECIES: hypothetical protein [Planktothricoides]MBD2544314.1 hypothetical protein [Planktothricoides raciborskii FACHB-1370]MBD2582161.1 hypothetical protein [Planktothricoides raciborskii FACHB-1261]
MPIENLIPDPWIENCTTSPGRRSPPVNLTGEHQHNQHKMKKNIQPFPQSCLPD